MTDQQLKEFKNIYSDIAVPQHIIEQKWSSQQKLLPTQLSSRSYYQFMPYGAAFASVVVFCFVLIGFAQSATQGTPLYPVKALTKNVSSKITNIFRPELQIPVSPQVQKAATKVISSISSSPSVTPSITSTEAVISENPYSKYTTGKNVLKLQHTELREVNEITITPVQKSVHNSFENVNPAGTTNQEENNGNVKGASTKNDQVYPANSNNKASNNNSNNNGNSDNGNSDKGNRKDH